MTNKQSRSRKMKHIDKDVFLAALTCCMVVRDLLLTAQTRHERALRVCKRSHVIDSTSELIKCEFQMGRVYNSRITHVGSASSTPCWEKVRAPLCPSAAAVFGGLRVLIKHA